MSVKRRKPLVAVISAAAALGGPAEVLAPRARCAST